jgi:integral membrane protein (TIGR01906 family)
MAGQNSFEGDRVSKFSFRLIVILLPVVLILAGVRLILVAAPLWIPIEYRMPGFPQDSYGFTLEDRVKWSQVDMDFLLRGDTIEYFDAIFLEDGSPMHNERELVHMEDVKDLVDLTQLFFFLGLLLILAFGIILANRASVSVLGDALYSGGRSTLILMGIIAVALVVAFGVFFVGFHKIFFSGDTWLFAYSDTFIRLYPERFWRDTFALLAIATGVMAWILMLVGKRIRKAK